MRRLARPLIALFLLWHVTAVTAAALPAPRPLAALARPYARLTGQRQPPVPFTPDPDATVPFFVIETASGTGWTMAGAVEPARLSPRIRPSIARIAEDVWRPQDPRTEGVVRRFLEDRCEPLLIERGSRVRLRVRSIRMPIAIEIDDTTGAGSLETVDLRFVETTCPAGPSPLSDAFPAAAL